MSTSTDAAIRRGLAILGAIGLLLGLVGGIAQIFDFLDSKAHLLLIGSFSSIAFVALIVVATDNAWSQHSVGVWAAAVVLALASGSAGYLVAGNGSAEGSPVSSNLLVFTIHYPARDGDPVRPGIVEFGGEVRNLGERTMWLFDEDRDDQNQPVFFLDGTADLDPGAGTWRGVTDLTEAPLGKRVPVIVVQADVACTRELRARAESADLTARRFASLPSGCTELGRRSVVVAAS